MEKVNDEIIIDKEFKTLLPPLAEDEYKKLSESLCKYGIRDPLKVWRGILIDGHNRYQISEDNDLNYTIDDMTDEFKNRAEVMQWIIDNQGARRNLTKSQLVQAYAKYEAELTKEARAKQSEAGGDKKSENAKSLSKNFDEAVEGIKVAAEVAKKIGVSEPTYRDMKVVVNEGTPEQIERMNKGGKGNGVSKIAREIRNKENPPITERECRVCNKILPITEFYSNGNGGYKRICKSCFNQQSGGIYDVKGKRIKDTGEFSGVSDSEIMGDLYNNSIIKISIKDVVEEFTVNLNSSLQSLRAILDNHKDIIKEKDNQIIMEQMWADATDLFQSLRKEYT